MDREQYITSQQKFVVGMTAIIAALLVILGWTAAGTLTAISSDKKETETQVACVQAQKQLVDGNCIDKGANR